MGEHTRSAQLDTFIDDLLAGGLSRRQMVKRAIGLGIAAPVAATLVHLNGAGSALAQGAGTLDIASYASDPTPRAQMEADVTTFQEVTGITVNLNTVNHEDFKQAIRTYLASDTPPDVLTWFAGNRMRFFVEKGLVGDVSEVYTGNGWIEDYPAGILAVSKGADEKFYFVPTNYYWWAVYYRKSLFEQAGITKAPETWEEFLAAIDALNAAGITPITIGAKAPWPAAAWFDYLNMRVNGPQFHVDLTDGKVAYNSDEVKATFVKWRELIDHNAFIAAPETMEWADALTPMLEGKAAMYLMGGFIRDSVPDEAEADLDFFTFPMINDVPRGEDAPTDGWFMAAGAKNVDSAKAFLGWVGGADYQGAAAESLKRIAIHKDVALDIYDEPTQKGILHLQTADYIAQFYDRDTVPEMAEKGMAAFMQFWANPDDIDAILDALDAERVRIFADQE